MKRTKSDRLLAIADYYRKTIGDRPFTTGEIAVWVEANNLWPVPTVRDPLAQQDDWDQRFEKIEAAR